LAKKSAYGGGKGKTTKFEKGEIPTQESNGGAQTGRGKSLFL